MEQTYAKQKMQKRYWVGNGNSSYVSSRDINFEMQMPWISLTNNTNECNW
jgi:hypothetical protein